MLNSNKFINYSVNWYNRTSVSLHHKYVSLHLNSSTPTHYTMVLKRTKQVTESSVDLTTLIKPSTSIPNLASIADEDTPSCLDLYGPYPSSIPVPTISKDGKSAPSDVVSSAKTMWDLSSHPDHRDVGTPDEWIPRHGSLVRLTGRHPFNVEPPLSVHREYKFITPACLHYVRNHGAVPNLSWESHTLSIGGSNKLVPVPYEIGMDELAGMTPRELPVTLVCAGNRRKEQNMIRQTIGFNWGAGGVSTNVWRGVMVRDLLLKAGVSEKVCLYLFACGLRSLIVLLCLFCLYILVDLLCIVHLTLPPSTNTEYGQQTRRIHRSRRPPKQSRTRTLPRRTMG